MSFQQNRLEHESLPLSALAFRQYLATYQLEPLDVALKSGVRFMTVWRIVQGQPVNRQVEFLVRQGLLRMTGIPYTAPLLTREETEEPGHTHGRKIMSSGKLAWE